MAFTMELIKFAVIVITCASCATKVAASSLSDKSLENEDKLLKSLEFSVPMKEVVDFERAAITKNNNKNEIDPEYYGQQCQLVPIVHLIQHEGCQPKAVSSFACYGSCLSYTRVSPFKLWEYERMCTCCRQTAMQEMTFTLDCPAFDPPYKKIKTTIPVDCICKSCVKIDKETIKPQELMEVLSQGD